MTASTAIALGVRTHSAHGDAEGGWATYVVLGGPAAAPSLLARGRMQLCDVTMQGAEQPYHEAATMELGAAEAFIQSCTTSSRALADRALADIVSRHGALKICCVLSGPQRPLPPLAAILASHGTQHTAEREFYREAVRAAAIGMDIATEMVRERDVPRLAERLPGVDASRRERLAGFRKQAGSPWAQDEKLAATAAWIGLDLPA
jgi:hypothetical protein